MFKSLLLLLCLACLPAQAASPIRWEIRDAFFDDGTQLTGYVDYDAHIGMYYWGLDRWSGGPYDFDMQTSWFHYTPENTPFFQASGWFGSSYGDNDSPFGLYLPLEWRGQAWGVMLDPSAPHGFWLQGLDWGDRYPGATEVGEIDDKYVGRYLVSGALVATNFYGPFTAVPETGVVMAMLLGGGVLVIARKRLIL